MYKLCFVVGLHLYLGFNGVWSEFLICFDSFECNFNCSSLPLFTSDKHMHSWTDANPWRRFYKWDEHGFFEWFDKDLPCLWRKRSLLEAWDKIRRQTKENKALCEALSRVNAQLVAVQVDRSTVSYADILRSVKISSEVEPLSQKNNSINLLFIHGAVS